MTSKDLVLVTGGTGFLAGNCIIALLARGYPVRTTVRDLAASGELRARIATAGGEGYLDIVAADLGSDAGWREAVRGARHVLHVASPFPPAQPRDADRWLHLPHARELVTCISPLAIDPGPNARCSWTCWAPPADGPCV